jgi:hypothetical protein
MPAAAGHGAIPMGTPAGTAAGDGLARYSVAHALQDLQPGLSWDDMVAILDRIEPHVSWDTPAFREALVRARPTDAGRRTYLRTVLRTVPGGRRRTRVKRKHFRKRTSRTH